MHTQRFNIKYKSSSQLKDLQSKPKAKLNSLLSKTHNGLGPLRSLRIEREFERELKQCRRKYYERPEILPEFDGQSMNGCTDLPLSSQRERNSSKQKGVYQEGKVASESGGNGSGKGGSSVGIVTGRSPSRSRKQEESFNGGGGGLYGKASMDEVVNEIW